MISTQFSGSEFWNALQRILEDAIENRISTKQFKQLRAYSFASYKIPLPGQYQRNSDECAQNSQMMLFGLS